MRRRTVLAAMGFAGLASASALTAGALRDTVFPPAPPPPVIPRTEHVPRVPLRPAPAAVALPPHFFAPSLEKRPSPYRTLHELPGDGNLVALTVDDGGSSETVALYAAWLAESGMRVTFFLNGSLPAWTDHADVLRPLIANGQVQMANHTWTHSSLPSLSDQGIRDDLMRNDEFIQSMYGVDPKPYFRPPFGHHDDRVDAVAASIGYTCPVMWYGSLADATEISDADLMAMANEWLLPQHIVIGHANYLTVTRHFREIADLIKARGLQPVTLDDLFLRP